MSDLRSTEELHLRPSDFRLARRHGREQNPKMSIDTRVEESELRFD